VPAPGRDPPGAEGDGGRLIKAAIRKVHDFLTIAAPAPLQAAGVAALNLPPAYYPGLATAYRERRDLLCAARRSPCGCVILTATAPPKAFSRATIRT